MRSSSSACWMSSAGQLFPFSTSPVFHLPEYILDAVEDAAVVVLFTRRWLELLLRQRFCELLEQLPLFLGCLLRRDDLHGDQQIAVGTAGDDVGHAASADAERRAALGAFRHLERLLAFKRRDHDLAAERGRRIVQRNLA